MQAERKISSATLQTIGKYCLTLQKQTETMAGIYLHIPFCKRRCVYCDFFSTTQSEKTDSYIGALCRELEIRRAYLQGEKVETVYFGGGTPSQLSEKHFKQVFKTIGSLYHLTKDAEITLEANPDDLTPDYIDMLRRLPFNRLSMGIQTFHEDTLKLLNRRHTARQAIKAFQDCRSAGFANISIDLIYGLPGETAEMWEQDLQQAILLGPEHISAYHLIYEKGTPLWTLREQHRVEEVSEETSVSLFALLIRRLKEGGYIHYEISNFCKPGFHSRHNSSYWTGKKYLGCGAAAHSYDGMSRQWNIASLDRYIKETANGKTASEKEELDLYTRYNDRIVTAMRTREGISLQQMQEDFGNELYSYCLRMAAPHLKQGTVKISNGSLHLTEKGVFVSDGIMSDLLWV